MSSSMTADLHQDTRLIERRLAKGFMSRAESDKLNSTLPDVADKAEWVTIEEDPESEED
jgi:hypothetical protein